MHAENFVLADYLERIGLHHPTRWMAFFGVNFDCVDLSQPT
jgi:hypothetical protein